MDDIQEALALAALINMADEVSMVTLTVRGKRVGIDPNVLRSMAALLLAYQRTAEAERPSVG